MAENQITVKQMSGKRVKKLRKEFEYHISRTNIKDKNLVKNMWRKFKKDYICNT